MATNLLEIADSIALSGGRLSFDTKYFIRHPQRVLSSGRGDCAQGNDDCDCYHGDCSDCYCTDCNEGHCE